MSTIEFTVTGMTCTNCEKHVREEVLEVPGVTTLDVSHESGRLTVDTDGDASDEATSAIIAAVEEAGYEAALA